VWQEKVESSDCGVVRQVRRDWARQVRQRQGQMSSNPARATVHRIINCVRCGGEHLAMEFRPFAKASGHFGEYACCDRTVNPKALAAACRRYLEAIEAQIPEGENGELSWEDAAHQAAMEVFWASGEPVVVAVSGGHHFYNPATMFSQSGPLDAAKRIEEAAQQELKGHAAARSPIQLPLEGKS
jgi:hypothetical protein